MLSKSQAGPGTNFSQPGAHLIVNLCTVVLLAFDVDPDGEGDVVLPDCAEEGAEVDEPVDAVRHDDLLQVLEVQDVGEDERACEVEDSDVEKHKVEKMCIVEFLKDCCCSFSNDSRFVFSHVIRYG